MGVHVSNPAAEVFLKDGSLNDGPDDEAFLLSLRRSLKTARGAYPPVALAEIYQEYKSPLTKIRRLHLMVVDLGRSRSVSPQVYQDFMNCLIHFMDLVLPQLTPVQAAWAGEERTLWSCHYIRWLRERHSDATPRVQISYFFSSHDNIHHVRIQWNSNPLLLFTDPTMVEALPVEHFSQQASHMTHQQHLQMGLRKGMAILIYYVIGGTHYQAVLLAEESVMNRGKRGENRLWKRVTPSVTEFAWLPPNLAESFCKNALYREEVRTYCAFDTPHLGLDTKNFVADVFVENILYLGDTRSADDLSVFTKMAPERLCLGCGLRVDEPFAPISTGERKKLFYAAQKLLTFVLHEVSAQTLSAEETALKIALRPLIINKDGHFVAAVTSMYQSLLEGKTDCPISGVFGAGKPSRPLP